MTNIRVGRYQYVQEWTGWIEPEDLSWIMFVRENGSPVVYLNRDPETGAVLPAPENPFRDEGARVPGELCGPLGYQIIEPPYAE